MILDTNALSAFVDGDAALGDILRRQPRLAIPVIVLGEFRYGIALSKHRSSYEAWLEAHLIHFDILSSRTRPPWPTRRCASPSGDQDIPFRPTTRGSPRWRCSTACPAEPRRALRRRAGPRQAKLVDDPRPELGKLDVRNKRRAGRCPRDRTPVGSTLREWTLRPKRCWTRRASSSERTSRTHPTRAPLGGSRPPQLVRAARPRFLGHRTTRSRTSPTSMVRLETGRAHLTPCPAPLFLFGCDRPWRPGRGEELDHAIWAQAVAELGAGVFFDEDLQQLPVPFVVADLLARGADGE